MLEEGIRKHMQVVQATEAAVSEEQKLRSFHLCM